MSKSWPAAKDPNDVADYVVNWADALDEGDALSSVTWVMPDGITKDSQSKTDTTATIWLSGGTAGETYEIICRVVTTMARTFDQTMKLKCKQR